MTINAPGRRDARLLRRRGGAARASAPERLAGTIQTDILKEYIAQKEWCFPIDPAMRLVTDMVEFCARRMPRWHPISISGYHIREAGSTAQQELAFTLKDGFTYVEQAVERGLDVDEFAPRLSFFFNAHIDFFEEIAKYRAARRIWARELRDTYGARDERSLLMRFHTPDRGRVADRAAAAQQRRPHGDRGALRGARRHAVAAHQLASTRRSRCRPRRRCALALRTQQIIAHETGVTNTIDPLGGSYFVESLTDRMEAAAYDYFAKIDELGGMVEAIKQNYPQREIADAAFTLQEEIERGSGSSSASTATSRRTTATSRSCASRPSSSASRSAASRPSARAATRDAVEAALTELREAAAADRNLMEPAARRARAPTRPRARSSSRSSASSGRTPKRRSSRRTARRGPARGLPHDRTFCSPAAYR